MSDETLDRDAPGPAPRPPARTARFGIGDRVRHRVHPFRGVVFDIDPVYANTKEWWEAIPEGQRPRRDQPYYHLLAENEQSTYVAYVSEGNLVTDDSDEPPGHPRVAELFERLPDGALRARARRVQ